MRTAVLLVLALSTGCPSHADDGDPCASDGDCGGDVCARDELCWPADELRTVKVTWTISGQPANAGTCAPFPDLFVGFDSSEMDFGFEPVPCAEGEFPVDKLPDAYTEVELGDVTRQRVDDFASIDATGNAAFDLAP